uniref:Uncharacterized protein n=1 Tax=Ailuropoda melanoleuca TaxID=9646 RepID=A0A7N5K0G5_AILME
MLWADEKSLQTSISLVSRTPTTYAFPAPLCPPAMLHGPYSLGLLACKLSFWTNLYKDAFSLGPLRSQMNKLHSGDTSLSDSNTLLMEYL